MSYGTIKQEEFIAGYNKIHAQLQKLSKTYFKNVANGKVYDSKISLEMAQSFIKNDFIPFMNAVHALKNDNEFLRRKLTDLYKINELRNIIVHQFDKNNGDYKIVRIAEPTDYSIDLINDTLEKLLNPFTIDDYLSLTNKNDVQYLNENDSIYKLFKLIKVKGYTQFPVFDNSQQFKGIVSDNGISFWLTEVALKEEEFGSVEISDVSIKELLALDETSQSFKIVSRNEYLYDILSYFDISKDSETTPILLVHSDGFNTSKELNPDNLVGILTSYDYLEMYAKAISKFS